jgi:hypothetical protein
VVAPVWECERRTDVFNGHRLRLSEYMYALLSVRILAIHGLTAPEQFDYSSLSFLGVWKVDNGSVRKGSGRHRGHRGSFPEALRAPTVIAHL